MKNRLPQGEVTYKRRREKKEVEKVNIVDVLPI
jgi:hypothetical protein